MDNYKFTKGKWKKKDTNNIKCNGALIACAYGFVVKEGKYEYTIETELNALLISKAPEMLEMLNKLLPFISSKEPNENKVLTNEIKQLIIQATELK